MIPKSLQYDYSSMLGDHQCIIKWYDCMAGQFHVYVQYQTTSHSAFWLVHFDTVGTNTKGELQYGTLS